MSWLWGENDPSLPSSDENADSNISAAAPSRTGHPMVMLDQLKHAGVPLKAQMNPYLQLDPSIFRQTQPQIILPEGSEHGRNKFEFYMGYVGLGVMGGYALGSVRGTYGELGNPQNRQLVWGAWKTRVLNAATKHGAGYAQTTGTAMFLYCIIEYGLKWTRLFGGGDDPMKSIVGATIAGALYRTPHGLRASGLGAATGLGLMTLWCLADGDSRRGLREVYRNLSVR